MWTPPETIPTPAELVATVDSTVAGLAEQKRRLAQVLVRHAICADRCLSPVSRNVLLLGPTGGGKTWLARAMCEAIGLPWVEVNCTQFTAAGYFGADLAEMFLGFFDPPWLLPGERFKDMIPVAERWGVVLLDEIDKWRTPPSKQASPERQFGKAEQAELLKLVEGDQVALSRERDKRGASVMSTHNILFIGLGAFEGLNDEMYQIYGASQDQEYMHVQPVDLQHFGFLMELLGRFPNILPLPPLTNDAMVRILQDHFLPRYQSEAENLGLQWIANHGAMVEIAGQAAAKQVGARGFSSILEQLCGEAFAQARAGQTVVLDADAVLGGRATWH